MVSRPQFVRKIVELGFCFPYIKNGYNIKQGKDQGGLPITRIETLSDNRFNRDKVGYADIYSTQGIENRILQDGDILMSHINSLSYLGRAVMYQALPGETFIHGMNLLRLKANRDVVDPAYAELYFQTPCFKRQILKIAKKAVNQASFSVRDLKELDFPLISLDDQHFVAERLHSITEQIARLKVVLTQLDTLIKSRFVEMFSDNKWPAKTIGELATDIRYGTSKKASDSGRYTYLRMNNITDDGRLDFRDVKHIDLSGSELDKCMVVKGDLLFNRTNSREKVGKTAVFLEDTPMVIAGYIIRVRLGSKIDSEFLSQFMNLPTTKAMLRSIAKGAVHQANINSKELAGIKVPVPPISSQQEFLSFAHQVDKSKSIAQKQIEKLQMLYDSLAQEYFGN